MPKKTIPIFHQFAGLQLQFLAHRYQIDHMADQEALDQEDLQKEVYQGLNSFQSMKEVFGQEDKDKGGWNGDGTEDEGRLSESSSLGELSDAESGYTSTSLDGSSLVGWSADVSEDEPPPTPASASEQSISDEESDEELHHSIYAQDSKVIITPKPASGWRPIKSLPKDKSHKALPLATKIPLSGEVHSKIAALNATKQWLPIPIAKEEVLKPGFNSELVAEEMSLAASSKRKKRGNRGRGHDKRRKLDRSKHRAETGKTQEKRLTNKIETRTVHIANKRYSLIQHGLVSKSGWSGSEPLQWSKDVLNQAWDDKSIYDVLKHFALGRCEDIARPLALLDCEDRIFFYRTSRPDFFLKEGVGFALVKACQDLIGTICDGIRPSKLPSGTRGLHEPIIIGYHREYSKLPTRTAFHNANFEKAERFAQLREVRRVCMWVSKQIRRIFPGIWHRFKDCVKWHKDSNGIDCHFDIFWNFCFNAMYHGQTRVHCRPHSDHKNVVGVCVVLVYELPNSRFDYKRRTWLVIWDAGIIIEMQAWTAAIYPSSLFYHFNIDLHDIEFVSTDGETPTRFNTTPIVPGDESGRGSMVFFNQASMFQQAELGGLTVQEAKSKGLDTSADYPLEVEIGFRPHEKGDNDKV